MITFFYPQKKSNDMEDYELLAGNLTERRAFAAEKLLKNEF
jgi:hypothetical protein